MASILLIEHQTIVCDAIRQFLFPQHRVVAVAQSPAAEEFRSYDLAIVDSETLRRLNEKEDRVAGLLAQAEVPVLWLRPAQESAPPPDASGVALTKPLEADTFRSAVEGQLADREAGPVDREHVIELTDVIAEDADEETN